MKRTSVGALLVLLASLVFAVPSSWADDALDPKGLDLAYIYYDVSGLPVPWKALANFYDEYRSAKDEFERREVYAQILPIMKKSSEEISQTKTFLIRTETSVGEYDFDREAFPLGISDGMFFTFPLSITGPSFAVEFTNASELKDWKIKPEKARGIAAILRSGRNVPMMIEYKPVNAFEDRLRTRWGNERYRIIEADIVKATLYTRDRRKVMTVLTPPPGERSNRSSLSDAPTNNGKTQSLGNPTASATSEVEDILKNRVESAEDCIREHGYSACTQ